MFLHASETKSILRTSKKRPRKGAPPSDSAAAAVVVAAAVVAAATAAIIVAATVVAAAAVIAAVAAAEENDDEDDEPEVIIAVVARITEHSDSLSPHQSSRRTLPPCGGRQGFLPMLGLAFPTLSSCHPMTPGGFVLQGVYHARRTG